MKLFLMITMCLFTLNACVTNPIEKKIYDKDGYDADGYNRSGFHRNEIYKNGYNKDGYDVYGYNQSGFNRNGFNKEGYDVYGYNQSGFNRKGFNEKGYDKNGKDKDGLTKVKKEKKIINKIVNSPDIKEVIGNIIKIKTKGKYESNNEYLKRIKNITPQTKTSFNNRSRPIFKFQKYDPDTGIYSLKINLLHPIYLKESKIYSSNNNHAIDIEYESSSYSSLMSNSFGSTVEVDFVTTKSFAFIPENLKEFIKSGNANIGASDRVGWIDIPVSKEQAMMIDNKWKNHLKFGYYIEVNPESLDNAKYTSDATFSSPTSYHRTFNIFKGKIIALIIYFDKNLFNKTRQIIYKKFSN